jgi:hypothetical protein
MNGDAKSTHGSSKEQICLLQTAASHQERCRKKYIHFNEFHLLCRCRCPIQKHSTYEAESKGWHLID